MAENTPQYAANIAVRAFLREVSKRHGPFVRERHWKAICDEFGNRCAYCGGGERLEGDHLLGLNRKECGLHHPGNIVPVCPSCHKAKSEQARKGKAWHDFVTDRARRERIVAHTRQYEYPIASEGSMREVSEIAAGLYSQVVRAIKESAGRWGNPRVEP
jgi:5-methylcytosine-specific restriction endonuclease McrA